MSLTDLVLVNFGYEYTTKEGNRVCIRPNERYILVSKTNDHWWHVRKDEATKPFYVPAKYVTELPPEDGHAPLAPPAEFSGQESTETHSDMTPFHPPSPEERESMEMTLRDTRSIRTDEKNNGHRISTFLVPQDLFTAKIWQEDGLKIEDEFDNVYEDVTKLNIDPSGPPSAVSQIPENTHTFPPPHIPTALSKDSVTVPALSPDELEPPPLLVRDMEKPAMENKLPKQWEDILNLMNDGIYESVPDVLESEPVGSKEMLEESKPALPLTPETPSSPALTSASEKVQDDDALTAVYVNVAQLRRTISERPPTPSSPSPPSPLSPLATNLRLDRQGWEVHTDHQSGQEFYYHPTSGRTTWEHPLSPMDSAGGVEQAPSPPSSLTQSPEAYSPPRGFSDWVKVLDETSGHHYFFNHASGQSSWDPPEELQPSSPRVAMEPRGGPPPLPEEDYPAEEANPASPTQELEEPLPAQPAPLASEYSLAHVKRAVIPRACLDRSAPAGWTLSVDPDGTWIFSSEHTNEQWIKSLDERGQTYYYQRDGTRSQWNLPELAVSPAQARVGNGAPDEQDGIGVMKNWRHSVGPTQEEKFLPTHRRNVSECVSDASSSPETLHHPDRFMAEKNPESPQQRVSNLEKAGILNKTKVSENGKKVRKSWAQSWTVLHGGVLTFHKDPKSTPTGASSKTNQIVPEFTVDLRGAAICWAAKEKSSKKNVVELKSRTGAEFLMQYDTDSIISDWYKTILDTIRQLDLENHSDEEDEISDRSFTTDRDVRSGGTLDKRRISTMSKQSSGSTAELDQKKVRNKLLKLLLKRPTPQSMREKGYIRDNVFGCQLAALCAQEKSTVPSFVEKCIRAVEERGLGIDGLYRVSGNLAVIQKLRFKADHEDLDLEEGSWDIHVITGALKLFFRELQEPLFPYSHFNSFVQGIKIPDYNSRILFMANLVKTLPPANHDTMEVLFSHLRNVIEHGEENRMTVQNVAIVFGPTLLKPEVESANITMYMIFQNQIVEFILNEFETIFHA